MNPVLSLRSDFLSFIDEIGGGADKRNLDFN